MQILPLSSNLSELTPHSIPSTQQNFYQLYKNDDKYEGENR